MHRDGYGFLISDRPIEGIRGDVYIPRESAQTAMHGDRVVVHIARIESDGRADGEIVKILRRAHLTVVGRVSGAQARLRTSFRTTSAFVSGSKFPRAWSCRKRRRTAIAWGSRRLKSRRPEDLDGMIVNVEILEFPEDGEHAVGRVIEDARASGRLRRGRRDRHPQAPYPASVPAGSAGAGAEFFEHHPAGRTGRARGFSPVSISSPSTARRRAISTTPFGWTGSRTATTRCRSTSPM